MEVEFFYVQCMYNILVSLHVSSSHENSLIYAITLWTKAITLSCHITLHLILILFQTIAQNCFHNLTFLKIWWLPKFNKMIECTFMCRQRKREWMKNKSLKRKHCRVNSKYRNLHHRMKLSRKNCKLLCLFKNIW